MPTTGLIERFLSAEEDTPKCSLFYDHVKGPMDAPETIPPGFFLHCGPFDGCFHRFPLPQWHIIGSWFPHHCLNADGLGSTFASTQRAPSLREEAPSRSRPCGPFHTLCHFRPLCSYAKCASSGNQASPTVLIFVALLSSFPSRAGAGS